VNRPHTESDEIRLRSSSLEEDPRRSVPWQRLLSRPVQYVMDGGLLVGAFLLSYALRFDFVIPAEIFQGALIQLPLVLLFQFGTLHVFGIYSFVWRYVGMAEMLPFLKAGIWSFLPLVLLRLGLPEDFGQWRVPLSVCLMTTVFGIGGVLALRVARRWVFERYEKATGGLASGHVAQPVLLVGAGQAGVLAAREIQRNPAMELNIKGFVDDDPEKTGSVIPGVKVLGTTRDLPRLVVELDIDHVVITIAKASRSQIRKIIEVCEAIPIKAQIIPGLYEILSGDVQVSKLREVQIEDLLGRDQIRMDDLEVHDFLRSKNVMVTGAGGSIGSELARQAARFGVGTLLLAERAEFALFAIDRELREAWPDLSIVPLVADVADEDRMRPLFEAYRPAVVVHAAAHKHVPMMESNSSEAVRNNILATRMMGTLAGEYEAGSFIQISTDKAVNPTSVMGASKRVAELVVQDLNPMFPTQFVSVRFGNVLGSAGSVIPIFKRQIEAGGPVTVTHPDMVRYFMTIEESAQLVLEAGALGSGGEIFVLDMGEPVRILDMAKDMITLYGLKPFDDIDIVFTGMRPGEKLFEELGTSDEHHEKTRHPNIYIGQIQTYPDRMVRDSLVKFEELAVFGREKELRRYFNEVLPEARVTE